MKTLIPGENRIFRRSLFLEDGVTALLVSALSYASVKLKQGNTVIATYVLGTGTQLRAGSTSSELALEITSAVTAALTTGIPLTAVWTFKVADAGFVNEPNLFIDLQVEQLCNVDAA